jgi:hypothetical protein
VTSAAGTLTVSEGSQPTSGNACDLNKDGTVNAVDVQLAINQVIGVTVCTNADLMGNGTCTVVDVQRIVNDINTGVCRTGP